MPYEKKVLTVAARDCIPFSIILQSRNHEKEVLQSLSDQYRDKQSVYANTHSVKQFKDALAKGWTDVVLEFWSQVFPTSTLMLSDLADDSDFPVPPEQPVEREHHLLWILMKTTGSDPRNDSILRLELYSSPICDPDVKVKIFAEDMHFDINHHIGIDPQIIKQHQGLWEKCRATDMNILVAEPEIIEALHDHYIYHPAGASVHLAVGFLRESMPELHHRLDSQHFDVGTLLLAGRSTGLPAPTLDPSREAHEMVTDVAVHFLSILKPNACD